MRKSYIFQYFFLTNLLKTLSFNSKASESDNEFSSKNFANFLNLKNNRSF